MVNTETVDETIPFETREEEDASLAKGQKKVKTEGQNGTMVITQNVVYENGVKATTTTIDKKVTDPVTQVVLVGTKETEPAKEATYTSTSSASSSVRLSNVLIN